MTAISFKVTSTPQKQQQHHRPDVLEVLVRRLIVLCTALAIVLSSIAVCDGDWLHTAGGRVFGLWHFCTSTKVLTQDDVVPRGGRASQALRYPWNIITGQEDNAEDNHLSPVTLSYLNCTTQFGGSSSGVAGAEAGLGLCRALVTLAVVAAIFGLELQAMSQLVSEGADASRRWRMGSAFVLASAGMSALGVAVFVTLLWEFATPTGFTLTFWSQFTAAWLFCLNGMAARHVGPPGDVPARDSLETC